MSDDNDQYDGPANNARDDGGNAAQELAKDRPKKRFFGLFGRKKDSEHSADAHEVPNQPDTDISQPEDIPDAVTAFAAPTAAHNPQTAPSEVADIFDDKPLDDVGTAPTTTQDTKVADQPTSDDDNDQADQPEPKTKKKGFFQRLKEGLNKSSSKLSDGVTGIFTKRKLDDETLEELEDLLISADLGVVTASKISTRLAAGRYNKEISPEDVRAVLADEIVKVLENVEKPFEMRSEHKPHIVLMVGVNGTGKTTTIGKLAAKAVADGYRPLMAAGDTFRAAAIEQLKVWGERTNTPVVARDVGADAAGLAYDAIEQARADKHDIVFIDTAGRLQNKANLMAELEKVIRVIKKLDPTAPHDVLLVLDATTGQNAIGQVEAFRETAGVTGLIMTKLDGTARGGILVAIAEKFGLPVHAIGVGETIDDLQTFIARDFADALVGRDVLKSNDVATDAA